MTKPSAAVSAPAAVPVPETVTLRLRKPIIVHGNNAPENMTELVFRLPSGATVLRLGEPFTTKIEQDGNGAAGTTKVEFKIIPALASIYLAEMTGVNADLLGQLHALDALAAFDVITRMLRPMGA